MNTRRENIEAAIGALRPALQADGADLRLLDTDGAKVWSELVLTEDACFECILPAERLEKLILDAVRRCVPDIEDSTLIIHEDPSPAGGAATRS